MKSSAALSLQVTPMSLEDLFHLATPLPADHPSLLQDLASCHCLLNRKHCKQAATARQLGVGRGIVKRLGVFCRRFIPWLNREKIIADWGPDPKDNPAILWSHFTRDLSQAFYPKRWAEPLPTQLIPISFQ